MAEHHQRRFLLAERLVQIAGESGDETNGVGYAFGEYVRDAIIRKQPFSTLHIWFKSISSASAFVKSALGNMTVFQKKVLWDGIMTQESIVKLVVRDATTTTSSLLSRPAELDLSITISNTFPSTECDLNLLCFDGDSIMSADEIRFPVKTLRRRAELNLIKLLREFIQNNSPKTVELYRQKLITKGFAVDSPAESPSTMKPLVPARPFVAVGPKSTPTIIPPRSPPLLSRVLKDHHHVHNRLPMVLTDHHVDDGFRRIDISNMSDLDGLKSWTYTTTTITPKVKFTRYG